MGDSSAIGNFTFLLNYENLCKSPFTSITSFELRSHHPHEQITNVHPRQAFAPSRHYVHTRHSLASSQRSISAKKIRNQS